MKRFLQACRGVTIIEFALVAPVLLLLIVGGLELGFSFYIRTLLEGEMQRASRDRALEDAGNAQRRAQIEGKVRDMVHQVARSATVTFTRQAFRNYGDVRAAYEPFNDANGNGRCDANEVFEDLNNNGNWDKKTGTDDSDGNARDVVIYTARVRHARLLPVRLNPLSGDEDIIVQTALRNQPFDQEAATIERSCS